MAVETPTAHSTLVDGDVRLRRARPDDARPIAELGSHPEIGPFVAALHPREPAAVLELVEAAESEPAARGVWVVEADGDPVGAMAFDTFNARSRIATVSGVMVHPRARGRGVGERAARLLARHLIESLGFHRVQLECYRFNDPATRMFERAGFTREGIRRRAYWRHGAWQDGALYGLVAEDLGIERRGSGNGSGRRPAAAPAAPEPAPTTVPRSARAGG